MHRLAASALAQSMQLRSRTSADVPGMHTLCISPAGPMQVLEVSAGTGRNVPYYGHNTAAVVFSDVSYDMLRRAKAKWEQQQPQYSAAFVLSDVEKLTAKVRSLLPACH